MKVTIEYCAVWNYLPQAARLAATIKQELTCAVELIPGANGIFEVSAGGKTLFSKRQSVRFPKGDEIVAALRKLRQVADW